MTSATSYHRMIEDISKIRNNWEEPAIPDEIIDAYKAGKDAKDKALADGFMENLERACSISEELFNELSGFRVGCNHVRLKAENYSCFTALYFVNIDDYVNDDKMNDVRKLSWEIENKYKTDYFHIDFMFTHASAEIELAALTADGFTYYYPSKSTPK